MIKRKFGDVIIRNFKVDREITLERMIDILNPSHKFVDEKVLKTIPTIGTSGGKIDIVFFPIVCTTLDRELVAHEFKSRKLIPDPVAQMQVNAEKRAFAKQYPNAFQWRNDKLESCSMVFFYWVGQLAWGVSREEWGPGNLPWWFGGVKVT